MDIVVDSDAKGLSCATGHFTFGGPADHEVYGGSEAKAENLIAVSSVKLTGGVRTLVPRGVILGGHCEGCWCLGA